MSEFTLTIQAQEKLQNEVPFHLQSGILRYVEKGIRPGQFLQAVFSNDLFEAMAQADETSLNWIHSVVKFIYNNLPMECHGSRDRMEDWILRHQVIHLKDFT